jgi:hypothetical protein
VYPLCRLKDLGADPGEDHLKHIAMQEIDQKCARKEVTEDVKLALRWKISMHTTLMAGQKGPSGIWKKMSPARLAVFGSRSKRRCNHHPEDAHHRGDD